jgi:hypothetical protein
MWKKSVASRIRHGLGGGRWWVLAGVTCVVGLALGGGCQTGTGDDAEIPAPEFGLGGKADGDLCDPAADLCWPTDQQSAMRTVFTAQDRLLLGAGDAQANARLLVGGLEGLTVKLTEVEREGLLTLSTEADGLSPDADEAARQAFLMLAQDVVSGRLVAHCISAQSVPVGSAAEADALGKADEFGTETDPGMRTDLTDGMRESLELLRQSGVLGKLYALMFEQLGGLDDLPPLFEEAFPFSEPREERVQRILDHYQLASAGASVVAGVEGLIPVAGIVISFSHKTVMDFRIRARLTLEIAMLYGIDVREGLNLFFVASTMMGLFDAADARVVLASNLGIRLLANGAFVYGVGTGLNAVVRTFATRGVAAMLAHMGRLGAELATTAVARTAGTQVAHQILGYLTLGMSVVVDAAATAYLTGRTGDDAHAAFRPWAAGMTTFSAGHLVTLEDRRCAALALGDMISADGTADATEQQLLAAHLGRAAWLNGAWQWFADEAQNHALEAASVGAPGSPANLSARQEVEYCLTERWRVLDAEVRLAALSDLYTMAAVDGILDPAELERYNLYESLVLDGVGLTNFDLRDEHLDLMRQVITTLLVSPEDAVPEEQIEVVQSVPVAARLPFLDQVPAAHQAAVTCAYLGTCP